jgi:hypothetical protein
MRQALIGFQPSSFSLRCILIKPPRENPTPATLKAVQVSLGLSTNTAMRFDADGKAIPPYTRLYAFVFVKKNGKWL